MLPEAALLVLLSIFHTTSCFLNVVPSRNTFCSPPKSWLHQLTHESDDKFVPLETTDSSFGPRRVLVISGSHKPQSDGAYWKSRVGNFEFSETVECVGISWGEIAKRGGKIEDLMMQWSDNSDKELITSGKDEEEEITLIYMSGLTNEETSKAIKLINSTPPPPRGISSSPMAMSLPPAIAKFVPPAREKDVKVLFGEMAERYE